MCGNAFYLWSWKASKLVRWFFKGGLPLLVNCDVRSALQDIHMGIPVISSFMQGEVLLTFG